MGLVVRDDPGNEPLCPLASGHAALVGTTGRLGVGLVWSLVCQRPDDKGRKNTHQMPHLVVVPGVILRPSGSKQAWARHWLSLHGGARTACEGPV